MTVPKIDMYNITIKSTTPVILNDLAQQTLLFDAINEYASFAPDHRDDVRVVQFYYLLRQVNKLPDGDYIELGTCWGLSLKFMHKFMDPGRMLYSIDTFEGFKQEDLDIEYTRAPYRLQDEEGKVGGFVPTTPERIASYLGHPPNLKIIKGWFPDVYKGLEDKKWRFVHIDMDLYQPTLSALRILWPQVVEGGMVVVHDYGSIAFACREAVDEFCASERIYPIELVDKERSIVLRKQES